jgi:hypothetical protein
VRSLFLERHLSAEDRREAERTWVCFVLEDLNGVGDVLRFKQGEPHAAPADLDAARARARTIVDMLSWDVPTALAHTWSFVETKIEDPEDAWGPLLVLRALEPNQRRVDAWVKHVGVDTEVLFAGTPAI